MFKLFRRLSSSVYQRPDRPWSEDATSNAPTIGRKRRIDDDDDGDDLDTEGSTTRKRRGPLQRAGTEASDFGEILPKPKETDPAVKEVTQGVREVEIEEKKGQDASKGDLHGVQDPEAVVEVSADPLAAAKDDVSGE
ncbi:hypothetical protein K488DRAFT_14937, partial [Vararia minispora EC-137]